MIPNQCPEKSLNTNTVVSISTSGYDTKPSTNLIKNKPENLKKRREKQLDYTHYKPQKYDLIKSSGLFCSVLFCFGEGGIPRALHSEITSDRPWILGLNSCKASAGQVPYLLYYLCSSKSLNF